MDTKTSVLGVAALLAAAAALLAPTQARAAEFYLRAEATTMPDPNGGTPIPMWGYALCTGSGSGCGTATVPGPALSVPAGDTVLTVHLLNALPQPTSLVINGLFKSMAPVWDDGSSGNRTAPTQRVRSFDAEAAPNGTQDYTWSNVKPGTYLYQSGTQPQVQVQMGLYGALTGNAVEATTTTVAQAYAGINYDNQATLLYSEIDPTLHAAVASGTYGTTGPTSTLDYQPKYFLINGAPYPTTAVISRVGNAGTTLLRFLNAGLTTHVPMIEGVHWSPVAEDGKPYPYPGRLYTLLLSAAKTMDVLLTPDAGGAVYAILDRRLNLSNNGLADGGMLAYLQYGAAGVGGAPGLTDGNVAPVAVNDAYNAVQGVTLSVGAADGVLKNDDNTDGVPQPIKTVAASGTTTHGSYTLNSNGAFVYTPATGYTGPDTFSYTTTDGKALSNVGQVSITVTQPVNPSLAVLDNFNRTATTSLGSGWSQVVSTDPPQPNLQVSGNQAVAASTSLGGLAIWNTSQFATQGAGFSNATPLALSAVVLKATGGSTAAPANLVRVRCELTNDGELVVATLMGGSNVSIYVRQAAFPAAACTGSNGSLSAVVDAQGLVTTFLNGTYVGGVQLPDVGAWKGTGQIGIQLQEPGATVDNFSGGSL